MPIAIVGPDNPLCVSIEDLPNADTVSVDDLPDVISVEVGEKGPAFIGPQSTVTLTEGNKTEATSAEDFILTDRYERFGSTEDRLKMVESAPRVAAGWKNVDHYTSRILTSGK